MKKSLVSVSINYWSWLKPQQSFDVHICISMPANRIIELKLKNDLLL